MKIQNKNKKGTERQMSPLNCIQNNLTGIVCTLRCIGKLIKVKIGRVVT